MENDIVLNLTYKQAEFHSAIFDRKGNIRTDNILNEFNYFGGIGSGKSRIVMTCIDQICRKYPNTHGVLIRNTYPELNDSVIPQYNTYFKQWRYVYNKTSRTCEYINGSRLDFRAFDTDTKILSNEYDFIAFCQLEEVAEDLFLQSLGRNRRKAGGLPKNIVLAEGNPSAGWVKARLKDKALPPEIFLVEAKTKDNPYLPPEYEINLRRNYPDFWIARFLDGEWTNLNEMVFSEFREENVCEIVDPKNIHRDYIRRNGFDWGWVNPCANLWGYTDYDGALTIYDEWYQNKTLPENVAKECNKYGSIITVADYAMKGLKMPEREHEDKTVWSELEANGMRLIPCNKEELSNIVLVNILLKTKKLRIAKNCVNLIKEVKNWKWKRIKLGADKNQFEEPTDKDNHGCDALNYLCAEIFGRVSVDSDKKKEYEHSILKAVIEPPKMRISSIS